ncbi:MAG TPA: flagellar basal body-associated FliL family protein [Candidatus Cloacimonadota bacterium]|nr:flagellar basal body-associated FliL family protein [Candidatus Cloacimonadota bacterium]
MKVNNSGKISILIIIIIVVLQIILAGALYFFVFKKDDQNIKPIKIEEKKNEDQKDSESDVEQLEQGKEGTTSPKVKAKDYLTEYAIANLSDIVINPKDSPESFLVVSIALEYQIKNENLPTELKNKDLLIKDKILTYFSLKSKDELQNIDNREIFKKEIKKDVNALLIEGKITNVLFPQYVMQ